MLVLIFALLYLVLGGVCCGVCYNVGQKRFDLDTDDEDLIFGSVMVSMFWPLTLPAISGFLIVEKFTKIRKSE